MERLFSDMKMAARALARRRGFSAVAVATLALGIGATTAIFSVVHGILLRPLPYAEPERLVSIWQTTRTRAQRPEGISWGSVPTMNFADWQRTAQSFEAMAVYGGTGYMVTGPGEPEIVDGASVSPDFFRVFGASPIVGRTFTAEEDRFKGPDVLVISHALWQERFAGRRDILGQGMEISHRRWQIVGVAPPGFAFPPGARLWSPIQNDDGECGRDCVYLDGVARLKRGASVEGASQEMAGVARNLEAAYPAWNRDTTVGVAPLQDIMVGPVRPAVVTLMGAVTLVLLIGCANIANLLLVRGAARQTEMAVRASLGASRGQLVAGMLAESLVLGLTGAVAGVLVAFWSVDALKAIAPEGVPRLETVALDGTALLFALGLALTTALLFGLGPAITLARTPLAGALRTGGRGETGDRRRRWQRTALLATEMGLSVVLLVGAGLLLRSFAKMQAVLPGFDARGVTVFALYLPAARYSDVSAMQRGFVELDEQLSALPGVEVVGRASAMPISGGENVQNIRRPEVPVEPGLVPSALYRVVDPDFFRALRIPMLRGRAFEPTDTAEAPGVALVSQAAALEFWPGEDPLGRRVFIANAKEPRTVVGVVGDVRSLSRTQAPRAEFYVPQAQTERRVMAFAVRGAVAGPAVLKAARDVVRAFDPKLPLIQPRTMAEVEARAVAGPRFNMLLVMVFALLAVVLAGVGVYGVAAYVVAQRTREIGIRMALGAQAAAVVRLVLWDGMRPALFGVVLGLAGALAAGRAVSGLLYGIAPSDPLTLAAVVPVLLAVVLAACLVPARRASRIPAMEALRSE